MKKSPSSLANKYGVQVKENTNIDSMGLNPNLNIEDSYIENLLKQIHFMNMEIKLLKEKQQQSENNALWSVINRTNQPLVMDIIESSEKYQEMKETTDTVIYNLEKDIICLGNEQAALLKQINFLQTRQEELDKKKSSIKTQTSTKIQRVTAKLEEQQRKLNSVREEKEKQTIKFKKISEEYQLLLNEDLKEKAKKEYDIKLIKNDENIEQMIEGDITKGINELKDKINKIKETFNENVQYQKAKEQQVTLKKKISVSEKQINGTNFELSQLVESIKMAEEERQNQIKQRKRLTENYESSKTMLEQILIMNLSRKEKQFDFRKKQSPQIQKAEDQADKLEKNLMQIRRKLIKSEQAYKNIKNEVDGYERELGALKDKRADLKKKYQLLTKMNQSEDGELTTLKNQLRQIEDQYEKIQYEDINTSIELFDLQHEVQYLRGKKEELIEKLDLKGTLNGLKVEDLQKVVQKNNDLNATVSTLMEKWEDIKSFSRM